MNSAARVCVFGGCGFIGQSVVSELITKGFDVTVCDKSVRSEIAGAKNYYECDLFDIDLINKATSNADYVFNFAGISDLDKCINEPFDSARINILGNINVLLASAQNNVKRFVYASSMYALGDQGGFYGCSKRAAEIYIHEFSKQMALPYTIIKFGSIYGAGSGPENPVYRLIDNALEIGRVQYTGDNVSSREYIDVVDAASASVASLGPEYRNKDMLVVGEDRILKQDFARLIAEILGMRFDCNEVPVSEEKHYSKTPVRLSLDEPIKYKPSMSRDVALSLRGTIEYVVKKREEMNI